MDDLPDYPRGYERMETAAENVKYVSPDRRANIVCKRVETHDGVIWSCTLYESAEAYGPGDRITSEAAEMATDVLDAVAVLHEQRRTL